MSVIESFATVSGGFLNNLAAEVGAGDARGFFDGPPRKLWHRMDSVTYSQRVGQLPTAALECSNHHFRSGKDMCWGLPEGTFGEFLDRLVSCGTLWRRGVWCPPLEREQPETIARDLLLCASLFPFRRDKSSDAYKYLLAPVFEARKRFVSGSEAVTILLCSVEERNEYYLPLKELGGRMTKDKVEELRAFTMFNTHYSVGTSPNAHDSIFAAHKVGALDGENLEVCVSYMALAELSRVCVHTMAMCQPRGRIGRRIARKARSIERMEVDLVECTNEVLARSIAEDIAGAKKRMVSSFWGDGKTDSCVYYSSLHPTLRVAAGENCVLVHFVGTDTVFCLSAEHVKCLTYVAMTHSTYEFYAASLSMEYVQPTIVPEEAVISQEVKSAVGQLEGVIAKITMTAGLHESRRERRVAGLGEVSDGIWKVKRFYFRIIKEMRTLRKQDYVGRLFTDFFAVYMSHLGGVMSAGLIDDQYEDIAADWKARGVPSAVRWCRDFVDLVKPMPATIAQDFARLNKIVYPYDVNPVQAFATRVVKMQEPNPRGRATFASTYHPAVEPFVGGEHGAAMDELSCAFRVLISVSEAKNAMVAKISREGGIGYDEMSYEQVLRFYSDNNMSLGFSARLRGREEALCAVPEDREELAYTSAKGFFDKGEMPTEPYAGAFFDVTSILPYKSTGDHDISVVKASSIPPTALRLALSTPPGRPRVTPCRDTEGHRKKDSGNMVIEYLKGRFPSRSESIGYLAGKVSTLATSIKVETAKCPGKDRIITSACGEARRVQSEYELNVGRVCKSVAGFTVGVDPADVKDKMYYAMAENVEPGHVRCMVTLDLSAFSTGMHWDVQRATNDFFRDAFDGGQDALSVIENATKDSIMVMSNGGIHLPSRNSIGANYEGLDGKRNTFMHCAMWYIARCRAYREGVRGAMRAVIFIDDAAAIIDVPANSVDSACRSVIESVFATYAAYGLKLSIMKTVVSDVLVVFLNEVYYDGAHVGYGFRALAHTGAQEFEEALTVKEELAVITSGVRGAAASGGHMLRLLSGFNFLLYLYTQGLIGNKGSAFKGVDPHSVAIGLNLPTIAGGFGLPNLVEEFSNLAGNRDVEKLDKVPRMIYAAAMVDPVCAEKLKAYVRGWLLMPSRVSKDAVAERVTVNHPSITALSSRKRDLLIAVAAEKICKNDAAKVLIDAYLRPVPPTTASSFPLVFTQSITRLDKVVPMVVLDKALSSDPSATLVTLIKKVVSSRLVGRLIGGYEVRKLSRQYYGDALRRVRDIAFSTN